MSFGYLPSLRPPGLPCIWWPRPPPLRKVSSLFSPISGRCRTGWRTLHRILLFILVRPGKVGIDDIQAEIQRPEVCPTGLDKPSRKTVWFESCGCCGWNSRCLVCAFSGLCASAFCEMNPSVVNMRNRGGPCLLQASQGLLCPLHIVQSSKRTMRRFLGARGKCCSAGLQCSATSQA